MYFLIACDWCSPLNDLLEKDDFTLEQVLQEDELIQEVKTRNTKLLELYVGLGDGSVN